MHLLPAATALLCVTVLASSCKTTDTTSEAQLYSSRGTVYQLTFEHFVEYENKNPDQKSHFQAAESQVRYVAGWLATDMWGGLKSGHSMEILSASTKPGTALTTVRYRYRGTIIAKWDRRPRALTLPRQPDRVFSASTKWWEIWSSCTNDPLAYVTRASLFYYWDPEASGCPLELGRDHDAVENPIFEKIAVPGNPEALPEYARLPNENGALRISVFLGYDDHETDIARAVGGVISRTYHRNDHAVLDGKRFNSWCLGFGDDRVTLDAASLRERVIAAGMKLEHADVGAGLAHRTVEDKMRNVSEDLRGELTECRGKTPNGREIFIRIFVGTTDIAFTATAFHYLLADAFAHDGIILYSGHAGLGQNLNPARIEGSERFKLNLNRNQYQIYILDACSAFGYYGDLYFQRKATDEDPNGSHNLDIIANGSASHSPHATSFWDVFDIIIAGVDGKSRVPFAQIENILAVRRTDYHIVVVDGEMDNP